MRIVQIVHGFPPNEWTGTELVTLYLSQALRERGHDVAVFTRGEQVNSPPGTIYESTFEGIPVARIVNTNTTEGPFRLLYDNPLVNRPVREWLAQRQPDVVHIQHVQHLSVSLIRLIAALGYPTVLNLHDFFFPCHRVQLIDAQQRLCPGPERGERCVPCLQDMASAQEVRRRFLDMERVLRAPDMVVTPSTFLADKFRDYFPFLEEKLRVVPHGVKVPSGVTRERSPRVPNNPLRILYVGVLAPHKGAHVLIEALKGIPRDAVSVSLYGLEWEPWKIYIEQLHTDATDLPVTFCGTYTHDRLGDILMQHDVLVMPMIWEESFSILTREAFLAGLPVIAARRGALTEAVQDGVNGLLFEPENAGDLRRCFNRLLTEPSLLEQLRDAAPRVKTMAEYAREIEAIYEEVRNNRPLRRDDEQSGMIVAPSFSSGRETTGETAAQVSVCIPTYNGAAFLAEAIRSVLSQSFQDVELLIIDDGSTDATLDIARSFPDARVKIYENEKRLGIPGNWNRCLSLAQGEYLCIFHQDDIMLPDNLARKIEMFRIDPTIGLVHSAIEFLVEAEAPNPPLDWIEDAAEDCVVDGKSYFHKLFFSNRICAPAVVIRRAHLAKIGQFDERLGFACDYVMWMKLCAEGNVGFISQPLLLYRWHKQNASHAFRFKREVDETLLARQDALRHYADRTGAQQGALVLPYAIDALASWHRRVVALDAQSERQLAYIREVEQMREKLWAEVQRVGKAWEDQYQYIQKIEQMKDKIWEDAQRVGKSWEEQKTHIENQQRYITDLEREQTRLSAEKAQLSAEKAQLITENKALRVELSRQLPKRIGRLVRRIGFRL